MNNSNLFFLITFLIEIIFLFFLSRITIKELFVFFRFLFKKERLVYYLISLIFFPGTIIHELSHFLTATILNLPVIEIHLFPEFKEQEIKLGHVRYHKKDFLRGILVGIAPPFFGLLIFWLMAKWNFFPSKNIFLNFLIGYFIFSVSTTMFSSKEDLKDFFLIIPFGLFVGVLIYIFDIKLDFIIKDKLLIKGLENFLKEINLYLIFSLTIHFGLIFLLKVVKKIVKR